MAKPELRVSVISYVETLGYHKLSEQEKHFLNEFFTNVNLAPLDEAILQHAIALRQARAMNLADSLIAGTALALGVTLVTRNTSDFAWISGLSLFDPFAERSD